MSDDLDLSGMSDREILIFLAKTVPGRLNDHGRRLKSLENFRNWAAGAGSVIVLGIAALKLKLSVKAGS